MLTILPMSDGSGCPIRRWSTAIRDESVGIRVSGNAVRNRSEKLSRERR